jgi:hypothetical protein
MTKVFPWLLWENDLKIMEENYMKRLAVVLLVVFACFATQSFAVDKDAIKSNVDEIVAAIDGGKDAASFAPDAYSPYAFIMEKEGKMLVHPSLTGEDLKEKAMPIFIALQTADSEGKWITYEWKGKEKHTYAKMTKNNLIVASGY